MNESTPSSVDPVVHLPCCGVLLQAFGRRLPFQFLEDIQQSFFLQYGRAAEKVRQGGAAVHIFAVS